MSQDFKWFEKDEIDFKEQFYRYMDLLVTNKSTSKLETILIFTIFYAQLLVGFFDSNIGVLDPVNSVSDELLTTIYNIIRFRGMLKDNYSAFKATIYFIFVLVIIETLRFLYNIYSFTKNTFYTLKDEILNFMMKWFLLVVLNPIFDITLSNICFETYNPFFNNILCDISTNSTIFLVSLILFFYSIFLAYFLNTYYNDNYFVSNSFYSRMNCGYEIFMTTNSLIYSILITQSKYLGKEPFLIYNLVFSLIMLKFFFSKFLFYDHTTNNLAGMFHLVYVWTSLYFLIFSYSHIYEKGIVYIIGCICIVYLFFNLKHRLMDDIVLNKPFYKITNKYHLMYYLKILIDKIQNIEGNIENKAVLIGIIKHHEVECPSPFCITKKKDKRIYLPITDEWSNRDKPEISDRVFLLNLVIVILNYFVSQSIFSPEILINVSLYYLQILGNYCQAIYFYNKTKELKLSTEDYFALERLKFKISKALVEKLRPSNEACPELEDLNVTYYYKYDDLSLKLFEEMYNDVTLSLEFWKNFKIHQETGRILDFNKIFKLTDKIRITKSKVEKIWNNIFSIFSGTNDLFELYQNYIEQINDDEMVKRDLDTFKNKTLNSNELIQHNYYNLLFNKETGVIILNGSKNKEGILERMNETVEKIFGVKSDEIKGQNITILMPKLFESFHNSYLQNFVETGEKKRIDRASFKSYAKDKENCIICMRFLVKLFPMLNKEVYYCGMALKENIDDIILIDSNYIIQGMSKKLMTKFEFNNKDIFINNDIPFYVICRKFLNFYRMFLKGDRNKTGKQQRKIVQQSSSFHGYHGQSTNKDSIYSAGSKQLDNSSQFSNRNSKEGSESMLNKINEIIEEEFIATNINGQEANKKDETLDINENIELEYEIVIPNFLVEYFNNVNEKIKHNMDSNMLFRSHTNDSKTKHAEFDDRESNDYHFEEHDNLIDDDAGTTYGNETKGEKNKVSDDEKDFQTKIKNYRNLFDLGKLTELDDLIQKNNYENTKEEYTFNITFEKYKFGDIHHAFIVRCIDTKAEFEDVESDNSLHANEAEKERHLKTIADKVEGLKDIKDVTNQDIKEIKQRFNDFLKSGNEDNNFLKYLQASRDDIANSSKIFGLNTFETNAPSIMEDENSSQIAGTGFNDNIAKKTRIEEIRSNIMHNVSNFYTIKWIRGMFYFIIFLTASFCSIYVMVTNLMYQDLVKISGLNIGLYQTTIWTCNIISSLVSLRSIYKFKLNNDPIIVETYLNDTDTYFESLRGFSVVWYDNIMKNFGDMEQKINYFFSSKFVSDPIWVSSKVSYPKTNIDLTDNESLNLGLAQSLSDTNNLLLNQYFTSNVSLLNQTTFTSHIRNLIDYSSFVSIENTVDNLLPDMFDALSKAPDVFTAENKGDIFYVIITILSYTLLILVMISIYSLLLYLTNKNMEEGLEKVSKIKLEKIEETIKKIELFNEKCLSRYRQKESSSKLTSDETTFIQEHNTVNVHKNENYQKIFSEGQKYKRLKVLSYSYFQTLVIFLICCANLIPIYLVSVTMTNNCNQIISVQNYIFGLTLTASANTVKIKCTIAQCDLKNPYSFQISLQERSVIESTIKNLNQFPELVDFYNNKLLLNACAVILDTSTQDYTNCMSDNLIKSANNTVSLLKLIDETVSMIVKDKDMKSNSEQPFTPNLLFQTENFKNLEYIYYKYITPVSDSFMMVVSSSLENYLLSVRNNIIILICIFVVSILIFCYYVAFIYTKKLIHLLSVARVILRIIPTNVIYNTQDLEIWIENKY